MIDIQKEVILAEMRIRPRIRMTILEYSHSFSRMSGANVYFKLENLQHTGSFKVRGAMNKILSLTAGERERGVATASTGNHGAAVAFCLDEPGIPGVVFAPENASPTKVAAMESMGIEVRHFGKDAVESEAFARRYARENGLAYVPPYNDPQVIGGQGVIGVELVGQLDAIDAVFVSLGGGGLISGVAGYLKSYLHEVEIIGCSPENSHIMIQSVKAGEILEAPSLPTLSDGTAGGVEPGSITFEPCRRLVDDYVTVTEDEIRESMKLFMETHHMMIEGAAAVAIASFLKTASRHEGENVVIIICGANISPETLKEIL